MISSVQVKLMYEAFKYWEKIKEKNHFKYIVILFDLFKLKNTKIDSYPLH